MTCHIMGHSKMEAIKNYIGLIINETKMSEAYCYLGLWSYDSQIFKTFLPPPYF